MELGGDVIDAYHAILQSTGDLLLVADWTTARFVAANDVALERLGYSMAELREMTGGDLSQFPRDEHRRFSQELIERGETHARAIPVRCRDGRTQRMDLWAKRFEANGVPLHLSVLRDTPADDVERQGLRVGAADVRRSEAFYRGVVTGTRDAVVVSDLESGETIEANPAACALFGYTTVGWRGVTPATLHPEGFSVSELDDELVRRGHAERLETPLRRADGTMFVGDVILSLLDSDRGRQVVKVIRNVTERQRRRQRLERAERLAAVGQVAAGVAHEVNNPAASALLNCGALRAQIEQLPPASTGEALETLRDIEEGLERVVAVARDLRQLWREDASEVVELDVNDVVRSTLSLLHNELRHRATLVTALGDAPKLAMRRGKLEQLLTNLLLNAAQAIVEGRAAANRIEVRTWTESDAVLLTVSDTGRGMDALTQRQIFDPFFTTKGPDEGAGLGLAMSAEIAAAHRGHLDVESELGQGSRFELRLPLDTGLTPLCDAPSSTLPRGRRALVIDDDPGMQRAYRRMLRGHDAVVVESGRQALELLETDDAFDVILCDLMMPDVDGPAVYEALSERAPSLAARMVFCTGGAFTDRVRAFVAQVPNEVLDKPLRRADLERLFEAGSSDG